jgi:hypothetical protein
MALMGKPSLVCEVSVSWLVERHDGALRGKQTCLRGRVVIVGGFIPGTTVAIGPSLWATLFSPADRFGDAVVTVGVFIRGRPSCALSDGFETCAQCTMTAMLTPPTDRLHKFFAIGGLALVVLGVTYPLSKFDEAQRSLIDTQDKLTRADNAYSRFAELARVQIARREATEKAPSGSSSSVMPTDPELIARDKATEEALAQAQRQARLTGHLLLMRNIWVGIGASCVVIGLWLAFVGFRQWIRQPHETR